MREPEAPAAALSTAAPVEPQTLAADFGGQPRIGEDGPERTLNSLLSRHPQAPIAAVGEDGLFVPMPEGFPHEGHPELRGSSALELVPNEDWGAVIGAWDRALATGNGRCAVHLISDPAQLVMFQALDVRSALGVLAVLFVPADVHERKPVVRRAQGAPTTPRVATVRKDARSCFTEVDAATSQILGWTAEEMVGRRSLDFIHPEDHQLAIENWMAMLSTAGHVRAVRLRHGRRDGSWAWFEVTNDNHLSDPERGYVACGMVDISAEMAIQEQLRAREQLLDRLAEAIPLGLLQVDTARRMVYTNDRLHQITEIDRQETVQEQFSSVVEADRAVLDAALDSVLGEGTSADIELELRSRLSHAPRYCTINLRALSDESGEICGAIGCLADITDGAVMREELRKRATFDELTGCHNRASVMLALTADIAHAEADTARAAIFIDLDGFKAVNDTLGHAAGDELLRLIAARLQAVVRETDIVGRFGGDEFLVMSPGTGEPEQAMKLAARLAEALNGDVRLAGQTLAPRASIGVAWSIGPGPDAEVLVAQADSAMYESKREGAGEPKLAPRSSDAPRGSAPGK
jgi:diguanylate cyclase (GGDEF)-like protein/PAS domain S-box-containing protein